MRRHLSWPVPVLHPPTPYPPLSEAVKLKNLCKCKFNYNKTINSVCPNDLLKFGTLNLEICFSQITCYNMCCELWHCFSLVSVGIDIFSVWGSMEKRAMLKKLGLIYSGFVVENPIQRIFARTRSQTPLSSMKECSVILLEMTGFLRLSLRRSH